MGTWPSGISAITLFVEDLAVNGSSPLAVPIPRDLLARISDHKATPRVDETVQVWSASTAPRKRMPRSLVWNRSV